MLERNIKRADFENASWGAAFLPEMDLVIAANLVASIRSGNTIYSRTLNAALAEHCAGLDEGCEETQHPDVFVPPNRERPYMRVDGPVAFLRELPRGHWAIFEIDGICHGVMSDGRGGLSHVEGYALSAPAAPGFDAGDLYGHVIGYVAYERQAEIVKRIYQHAFEQAQPAKGDTFRDMSINGKTYTTVEFLDTVRGHYPSGDDAVRLKAARKGVKAREVLMPVESFARHARFEISTPPEFDDPANGDRLVEGLGEPRRAENIQIALR
jgi:hypothetical protein